MSELHRIGRLPTHGKYDRNLVFSIEGCAPTISTSDKSVAPYIAILQKQDYIEIPTWPSFNNMNRVYLSSGISPTLTTQCEHSKPPLILVEVK